MNIFTTSLCNAGSINTEKTLFSKIFPKLGLLTVIALISFIGNANAQLTGIKTIPGNYASISAAITDLNAVGVGAGGVTFNISGGYTETLTARQEITATGTAANPIVFQKSGGGANPLVTSYVGTIATPSTIADGFFVLAGSDYVTFDGIDLMESVANTTNTTVMEFGFGLFKASASDGCQNNTIKNCVITLNRDQNTAWTSPGHNGSTGIAVLNGLYNATGAVTVTAASGSNSNNKFYTNTIQNCNAGVVFIGYADVTPFSLADTNNDFGGATTLTGNSVLNFGGGAGATNPATGIFANNQYGFNCSRNTINNNNGSGVNHITTLRGIFLNTSSTSASVDCNFNTITINGGSTTSQISCIENGFGSTAAGNTVNINNNTIQNCTWTTATSGTWYGIWNNAASPTNLNINNNTFTNNQTNGTGSNYLIYNSGAVAGQININNNNLSRAFVGNASTGTLYSIYNTSGTTSTKLNINGNTFSNYSYTNTGTGALYFIYNSSSMLRNSISNNTWNNLSLNHSGTEYLIYNASSTQSDTLFIQNNTIQTAYTRTAAAATMYCYYGGSSSLGTNTQIFSGNNFSNITASTAGTGTFYGIYNSDGVSSPYPKKFVYNNTISNNIYNSSGTQYLLYMNYLGDGSTTEGSQIYDNTINGFTGNGTLYGLYIGGTVSPSFKPAVYNNQVYDLTSNSTSASMYGSYLLGGGAGLNFYKNKIYNIQSNNTSTSALTCGTYISSALATAYYNNYVGDIKAPTSANPNNGANGVYISGGTLINMYYNTIYLSGTSSGTNFGGNALYASTSPNLTLNNNIFDNLISPKGTGLASAYRRSSSTLTSYNAASNNNAFYAGTPSASNLIFTDGTTPQQTMAGYKSAVSPSDAASVTENVNFISTIGANATYLHINPAIATQLESNAINISGITDDYDADIRQGNPGYAGTGSGPDIGADEGEFIPMDITGPGINYTVLAGSCGTGDFLLNGVVITDVTGVPTTGSYVPRVYFQKNAGPYFSSPGTLTSGNGNNGTWNFTISAATMGGLIVGDIVSYYVIAQDNVIPTNISSNPGGVVATDVLTVTTPPVPNTASILSSLSGTYTVGVSGDYPTLTAAVNAYNTNCVNGPVVFNLIDATYPSETFPISINQVIGQSAINTLTIKPAVGNSATISGSSTSCIINFNGADYVTLDGSNSGGTDRSLTLENTATVASRAVVCVTSLGTGLGATNDVIKNCVIKGGSNTVANFGVYVAGAAISTTGTGDDNDKLTIQNNDISTVQYGIFARASSVAGENDSLSIIQNSIGSATAANYVTLRGIDMTYNNEALVSQNSISNMITTTLTSCTAIECGAGIQNASITRNNISGIYNDNAGQWAAYGINFNTSTSVTNNLIANNFISDMRTVNYSGSTTFGAYGIRLTGGTNFTIVNNSVHFFGVVTIATGSTCYSSPLLITSATVTGTILKNNIFFNEQSFLNSATSLAYSLYVPSGYVFAQINNNDYFGASIAPTTYYVGYNGTNRATLADWQTAYPADNMSLSIDPLFTSSTDLHIVSNTCLNQGGMPIANVTDDYDGQLRSTTLPDIGADEFTGTDVTFAFTETSGVANNDGIICEGATVSFTATNG